MNNVTTAKAVTTTCVLANITDMVHKVIKQVAGNDISSTINGSKLSRGLLTGLVHNRIKDKKLS